MGAHTSSLSPQDSEAEGSTGIRSHPGLHSKYPSHATEGDCLKINKYKNTGNQGSEELTQQLKALQFLTPQSSGSGWLVTPALGGYNASGLQGL